MPLLKIMYSACIPLRVRTVAGKERPLVRIQPSQSNFLLRWYRGPDLRVCSEIFLALVADFVISLSVVPQSLTYKASERVQLLRPFAVFL